MKKTILIAGYTKISHLDKIRTHFTDTEVVLACAYERHPHTETKEKYLSEFDMIFNLNQEDDKTRLVQLADEIDCVTCTQERDMPTYFNVLSLTNKISTMEREQYATIIDKHTFKAALQTTNPELVPNHRVVDQQCLKELEQLTYPQVIKPSGLAGSIMVKIVNSPEEFKTHYETFAPQMQAIAKAHYQKEVAILTEEYINGPQYSVNVYIDANGVITICPLVRVVTPQEIGIDDTYSVFQYTTEEITGTDLTALETAVKKVADHFCLRNTSAHFDSVLHNGQWKFFEVGLRIGGNRQKLYEFSHGMNHILNDILNRLGHPVHIPEQKKSVCIVQKAAIETGILTSIHINRTIQTEKPPLVYEDKLAKIGEEVKPISIGGGTISRHFVTGKNTSEVLAISRDVFDSTTFTIV